MAKELKIKVCGLKNAENFSKIDALDLNYVGMIFYEKSPRYNHENPLFFSNSSSEKVGVFVNESVETIEELAKEYDFKIVQLHGKESNEVCKILKSKGFEVWKAFGVNEEFNFEELENYPDADKFLFDTFTPIHGGSGKKFNWELLVNAPINKPFFLSGGIGINEVNELASFKHPYFYGVDVNSKFELEPGLKDVQLVKKFISSLKNYK